MVCVRLFVRLCCVVVFIYAYVVFMCVLMLMLSVRRAHVNVDAVLYVVCMLSTC